MFLALLGPTLQALNTVHSLYDLQAVSVRPCVCPPELLNEMYLHVVLGIT
jgi:hypothetical protein